MSYESPIMRLCDDIVKGIIEKEEGCLMECVHNVGFDINKAELYKALAYDRGQYDKGYADAMANIVHCRNCAHATQYERTGDEFALLFCEKGVMHGKPIFFCGFGERRKDND